MKKFFLGFVFLTSLGYSACNQMTKYQISTGSTTGTYYQIGLNLAKFIAPKACIELEVISSKGSLDNVYKLRSPEYPKLKFAIVQNDVLQELKRLATLGDSKARDLVNKIRVIKALYNEEIHIIAKKNSSINSFGDLKGKTISVGENKSGTAMTSLLLYKSLFSKELSNFKFQIFKEALISLETGEVDAVVKVAGQPTGSLTSFKSGASEFIKLLPYDERNSQHNVVTSYYDASIMKNSYEWLNDDVQTLSTKAYLITFDYQNEPTRGNIKEFSRVLFNNLELLQKSATKEVSTPHLKWNEVQKDCNGKLPGVGHIILDQKKRVRIKEKISSRQVIVVQVIEEVWGCVNSSKLTVIV